MLQTASIIDYPRTELDKTIWKTNGETLQLQPGIKDEIADIIGSFLNDLDLPEEAIKDVFIYGSILTNQYNTQTDVDARILLDPEALEAHYPGMTGDELYDLTIDTVHGILLGDTKHPFNATIVIENEETELGQSQLGISDRDPVYSIKEEKVVHEGNGYDESFDPDVEFMEERTDVKDIMTKLDNLVQDAKTDTIDIEMLEEAIGEVANPDRLIEKIEDRLGDLNFTIEKMVHEYNSIKEDRSKSYKEGPTEDRHKAPGNIRFKFLEKYRYMDMLKKLKRLFKDGIDPSELDDVAETLNVKAYPYSQPGLPTTVEAPPTSPTGPAAPTNIDQGKIDEGGMLNQVQTQGSTCPNCGHVNPMTATESDNVTCEGCGKKFNAKDGFSLGTGISTIPETTSYPYESDFPLYGQTMSPQVTEDMIRMLRDVGIPEEALKQFEKQLKGEPVEETEINPEQLDQVQQPEQPGQLAPILNQPGVKNVLKPGIEMNKLQTPTAKEAHLLVGVLLMENLIEKLNKIKADSTGGTGGQFGEPPGKNPGDSPYAGGGALAEYGTEGEPDDTDKKKKKKNKNVDDDTIYEIVTVLDGIDIIPFLEDDSLLDELLAAFPMLGEASAKIDRILGQQTQIQQLSKPEQIDYYDLGYTRPQIQQLLADLGLRQWSIGDSTLILKDPVEAVHFWEALQADTLQEGDILQQTLPAVAKKALLTDPPAGTGQYDAPNNPDYNTEPRPKREKFREKRREERKERQKTCPFAPGKNIKETGEAVGIDWFDTYPPANRKQADDELKELLTEWLEQNPNPDDDAVHAFAEEIGMEPDDLEEIIYELATEHVEEDIEKDPMDESATTDNTNIKDELTEEIAIAIGDELGINWENSPFDAKQFLMGIKIELEHGTQDQETNVTDDDLLETGKIALAHLNEIDDYYDRLKAMEDDAKSSTKDNSDEKDSDEKSDTDESSGGSVGGFNDGFPASKTAAAYMTLCPQCNTIQKAPMEGEGIPCPSCGRGWLRSLEEKDPERYQEHKEQKQQEVERSRERTQEQRGVPLSGARLDGKVRRQINEQLQDAGMDGNGRFETAGSAFSTAVDILNVYKMQPASDISSLLGDADILTEEFQNKGRQIVNIETLDGEPLDNTMLVFSYYQILETGQYEILAMLS